MVRCLGYGLLLLFLGLPAHAEARSSDPPRPRPRPGDVVMEMDEPPPRPRARRAIRATMGDVVVSGNRVEEPVSDSAIRREVLTPRLLREKGARTLGEALQDHVGAQVGSQFHYERGSPTAIQLRGCDPRRLLILVDGRRIIGTADSIVDVAQLPLGNSARVEIIKGPASVLYGADALCGVIQLFTGGPPKRGLRLNYQVEYGSYDSTYLHLDVGARPSARWAYRLGASYRRRAAFDLDTSTPFTDGDAFQALLTTARLDVRPVRRLLINVLFRYVMETRQGLLSDPTPGGDRDTVYDTHRFFHRPSVSLLARWRFNASDRLTLRLYHQAFLSDSTEDQLLSVARRLRQTQNHHLHVDLIGRVLLGTWNLLTAGFETNMETLRVDRREVVAEDDGPQEVRAEEVAGRTVHTEELFVQDEMSPWPWLTVVPGLRYTHHRRFGHHATPKLSILVEPAKWLRIRVSYGHGFRAPTLKNLYYHFDHSELGFPFVVRGNPGLDPETAHSVSGGVELRPCRGCLIQAAAFFTDYRDLITQTQLAWHDDGYFFVTQQNVGHAQTYGAELGVQMPLGRLFQATAGYLLLYGIDRDSGLELPNRPRHQIKMALRFHHPKWGTRAVVYATYLDKVWVDMENRERSPGYLMLNAQIEQRVRARLFAYVRGTNLTNSRRDGRNPLDLRPQPGWMLFGGVRGTFQTP